MASKSSTSKSRSYKLQKKYSLLGICQDAPKWKAYGLMSKGVVQYSNLLKQKRKFLQLMKNDTSQIACCKNSCCIVDKNYSLNGSNIEILIFDENEHHNALYLEYFVDKQTIFKKCNKLLTFLNLKKTSIFHIQDSFIYVKSADGLKWELFYDLLEFLLKKHNKSVLGSQFYFPLTSKYLIMNELRLSYLLQNVPENLKLKKIFEMKISSQSWKTSISSLCQKGFPIEKSRIRSTIQNVKKDSAFFPTEVSSRIKNVICDKYNLKRKYIDSDENKHKIRKLSFESFKNSSCHCQSKSKLDWKIFKPFHKNPINYNGFLKGRNWLNDSNTAHVISFDSSFDVNSTQHSNSQVSLNKDSLTVCNISKREISALSLDKVPRVKKITGVYFSEAAEQSKFKQISDLCTLKEIVPTFHNGELPVITNPQHYQVYSANTKKFSKNLDSKITKNIIEEKENIAGPSKETFQLGFVSFQTAHGKALKISEKALKVAEKMFEEVCAEELDVSDKKFKSELKNNQKRNGFDEKKKDYVDEDINSILVENFFEDIPFDEREIECKPTDISVKSPLMKSDVFKTTQNQKMRKSLGGRRCLKPYTLNK